MTRSWRSKEAEAYAGLPDPVRELQLFLRIIEAREGFFLKNSMIRSVFVSL